MRLPITRCLQLIFHYFNAKTLAFTAGDRLSTHTLTHRSASDIHVFVHVFRFTGTRFCVITNQLVHVNAGELTICFDQAEIVVRKRIVDVLRCGDHCCSRRSCCYRTAAVVVVAVLWRVHHLHCVLVAILWRIEHRVVDDLVGELKGSEGKREKKVKQAANTNWGSLQRKRKTKQTKKCFTC